MIAFLCSRGSIKGSSTARAGEKEKYFVPHDERRARMTYIKTGKSTADCKSQDTQYDAVELGAKRDEDVHLACKPPVPCVLGVLVPIPTP